MKIFFALAALVVASEASAAWEYQVVKGAGGVPLNVVTVGEQSQPAILFIHGIGQSHYSFRRQLDSDLADEFYLVAFDLRGHGSSGKPWVASAYDNPAVWAADVNAVIAGTGIERPVLVGWSYGTLVAMDFVREHGVDGLSGIVLTGGHGALRRYAPPANDDPLASEFARFREQQLSPNPFDNIRASEQMANWLTAHPLDEEERRLYQMIGVMLPPYARRSMVERTFDNEDLLARLRVPVLLSLGEKDNPQQLEDAREMMAAFGSIQLSVYEDAGHSVFIEQPVRFNAELREFARRAHAGAEGQ